MNIPEWELERISQEWDHSGTMVSISLDQVQVKLKALSVQVDICIGILGKIRDAQPMLEPQLRDME